VGSLGGISLLSDDLREKAGVFMKCSQRKHRKWGLQDHDNRSDSVPRTLAMTSPCFTM
jgi:hypothetical protein